MIQGDTVLAITWQLKCQRWGEKHVRVAWLTHGCCFSWEQKNWSYMRSWGQIVCLLQQEKTSRRVRQGRWAESQMESHRKFFEGETWLVRVKLAFKDEFWRLPGSLKVKMVKWHFLRWIMWTYVAFSLIFYLIDKEGSDRKWLGRSGENWTRLTCVSHISSTA